MILDLIHGSDIPLSRIVPTEYDSLFRKQLLHGTVHDEGAAMLGGISGHAGLFATANDLMKLMELYRRMGSLWRRTDYQQGCSGKNIPVYSSRKIITAEVLVLTNHC